MTSEQLQITKSYDSSVEKRKNRIKNLMDRTGEKLTQWRKIFGIDTPVPIDQAYHQLRLGLRKCQTETAEGHIEQAEDFLEQADWMLQRESGSNVKTN